MKRRLLMLFVALATGLAVITAHASGTTNTFTLEFQGPTGFVDAHPHAKGTVFTNPLPGDELLARSRVLDETGARIGRTSERCTMVVRIPATYDCTLALLFADRSELLVHGAINPMRDGWTAPVVGGTGRYAGARGTVSESGVSGNSPREDWVFTLS